MKQSVGKCESTANHVKKKKKKKKKNLHSCETLFKKNKKNKTKKKHTHWIWEGQEVFFADEKFTFLLTDKATVLFTWTLHWLIYIPSQYILTTQYLLSESDYFQHSCQ